MATTVYNRTPEFLRAAEGLISYDTDMVKRFRIYFAGLVEKGIALPDTLDAIDSTLELREWLTLRADAADINQLAAEYAGRDLDEIEDEYGRICGPTA
ncbi:hypothetical protein O7635_29510 [Asanoa sp. WMMD1127]|uniref:hypothetical protein n=1 Tax=Asanoa sp. WMMD1127 TaxID=3016107 RepID=UPI002415A3FD|nr:hypothetical protein [Asanoa sp. WMMD1127]MDG4826007.1 hypothetical protein [Asanoa sp. WMMD1127]